MKKYFVVTLAVPTHYDHWGKQIAWEEVRIVADYMKLENGHLIFREEVRSSYPNTVRVFAPGAWREVIELVTRP
jgi:hypothetical protein